MGERGLPFKVLTHRVIGLRRVDFWIEQNILLR